MGLGDLLDQVRQYYLERFSAFAKEKRANRKTTVILEPVLRDRHGVAMVEGQLQLGFREDLAVVKNDVTQELFSVDTEGMLAFEPLTFDWDENLHVSLGPFQWQAMTLRVPHRKRANWQPLQKWFWRWFRQHEEADDDRNLLGAVHFLSDPDVSGKTATFQVDLGSAPVEAFEELLDAVAASGVKRCEIGETS